MAQGARSLTFGVPRMHKEVGERRDFLPSLVELITSLGVPVFVETGIGSGMGFEDADYMRLSPLVRVVDEEEAYRQDVVLLLRAPDCFERLRPGATLVSMLHFPTRPDRVMRLRELGVAAVSLDTIVDDDGFRLVENGRAVAWNGLEAAFGALEETHGGLADLARAPIRVTILGAGLVGKHAVEAATKFGDHARATRYGECGVLGVEATTLGRNVTWHKDHMLRRLGATDILVDASQRSDPSHPLIPNDWLGELPMHSVVCDLVVDPYLLGDIPPTVRAIEGIPQGNLDRYVLDPADPAWERTVPATIPTRHRRTVASCYSWPGVHPEPCMIRYGRQLAGLLPVLIAKGGAAALRPDGDEAERALYRASLAPWTLAVPDLVVV